MNKSNKPGKVRYAKNEQPRFCQRVLTEEIRALRAENNDLRTLIDPNNMKAWDRLKGENERLRDVLSDIKYISMRSGPMEKWLNYIANEAHEALRDTQEGEDEEEMINSEESEWFNDDTQEEEDEKVKR